MTSMSKLKKKKQKIFVESFSLHLKRSKASTKWNIFSAMKLLNDVQLVFFPIKIKVEIPQLV